MDKLKHSFLSVLVSFLIGMVGQSLFSQNIKISRDSLITIVEFDGAFHNKYTLKRLMVDTCKASSVLRSKNQDYSENNLIDDNDHTAWVEGLSGSGIGEKIRITFKNKSALPYVIRIVPGYSKSEETWYNNNRVANITIRTIGVGIDSEYIIDEWKDVSFRKDSLSKVSISPQYIDISQNYIQHMGYNDFVAIEFEIMEVDDVGAIYNDTCISEISFYEIDKLIKAYSSDEYEKIKN
ncbi:NADase-type glycan-binding domain-containing protein [Aquimarina macrocephali]|uniref:NADase-type glycan-binding domain-containing protein n=1 Tax=Aquimarina macrocephali TaxID=666563 RepID=UPI003F664D9D